MRRLALAAALSVGVAAAAWAHHAGEVVQAGSVVVSHAWTVANADMAHATGVYLTLDNRGETADRLTGAAVDFADSAVFQAQALGADGTLEVQDVAAVAVQPGQVLTLQPGVAWIELQGLKRVLAPGETFELELVFGKGGEAEVLVRVEEAKGRGKPAS
jgi:periplasmic copper chaperone A